MTRALLSADRCPVCTGTHPHRGDWPTCPQHGHLLYQLRVDDTGWTYTCPASKCKHTHTQKEQATMTTANEHATAALAIRDGQEMFTPKQLAALAQLGIKDASNADLAVFMHYCQKTGLDPFSRQIYMIGRRSKQDGEWVTRQTIQVGIDGYRVIAQRAARRDNVSLAYGGTIWYDANGQPHDVWVDPKQPPAAAAVIVYRDGKPFPGTARFASFAAVTKDGQLMGQWATMPDHMIAKCAEAQALRKAFPHDLVGISTDDENAHIGNHRPNLAAAPYAEPLPEPLPRRKQSQEPEMVKSAIVRQFDRLDIDTDTDERDIITCRLVGADTVGQLTPGQFEMVLSTLESCDDRTDLDKILAPDEEPMF